MKKGFKSKSILSSALWYTIGTCILQGISFLTIPIFTRLMSTSDYGQTSIYGTWSSALAIIMGLGIKGTLGSAKANLKEKEYNEYLSSTLFLATISFLVMSIIAIIFIEPINSLLGMGKGMVIILFINSFATFIIGFASSYYTFEKDHKKYLLISFIVSIGSTILSLVLILNMSNNRYLGKIYGGAIISIAIAVVLYVVMVIKGKSLINFKYWKFCIPIAIPIIFHNLSHYVLNQADRVMLQGFIDEASVGVYSFTYNIGLILNIIHMSINSAWVAWYFDWLKNKAYKEIKEKSKLYIIIFTILTSLFLLGGPEIIKILSPIEYWDGIFILPIIIVGYFFVFLYTFSVNYEFYIKKTNFVALGTIVAAMVNIFINIILIPKMGIVAAALSTLIAYFILFIMHEIIVRIIFKHRDFNFRYYIYSIIVVLISTIITYVLINEAIIRWIIITIIAIVVLRYIIILYKQYNNTLKQNN